MKNDKRYQIQGTVFGFNVNFSTDSFRVAKFAMDCPVLKHVRIERRYGTGKIGFIRH